MSKFKVGDRVRVVQFPYDDSVKVGDEGVVVNVRAGLGIEWRIGVNIGKFEHAIFAEDELELVTDPKKDPAKPSYEDLEAALALAQAQLAYSEAVRKNQEGRAKIADKVIEHGAEIARHAREMFQ